MKLLNKLFIFAISVSFLSVNGQEKKIKFNKGTLKICSSKNFQIEGYNGDEVIIKSLHEKRGLNRNFVVSRSGGPRTYSYTSSSNNSQNRNLSRVRSSNSTTKSPKDSIVRGDFFFINNDNKRKAGLKKLGKKNENSDLGIYFIIEQNGEELVFKDNNEGQLIMMSNERYEIKVPNSLKLDWQTNGCITNNKSNQYRFFSSQASSLSNFNGEVEISSTLNNTKLLDVTGPVSINTIGGNVTIEFDKKAPQKLYSIYSNNGFIDITLPINSDIRLDATANDIFSDIDFKVEEEKEDESFQHMRLKLKSGKVKMKLNAGMGNIYLRKK